MERTRMIIFVLFTAMSVYSVTGAVLPKVFPYTLQEATIKFTKEPESKSVLAGSTVTLSCNTTVLSSDNYRLPELLWRFNGQLLDNSLPLHLTVHSLHGNARSELTIERVSQSDSGYYECVVYDGYHVLESGKNAYVTIMSSSRARLEVIDVNLNVSRQKRELSVVSGGHLQLPCETGAQKHPMHSVWKKDGQPLIPSQTEVVLGNGTLLLLEVNVTSAGVYQCTGHYHHKTLSSATYNVSISEGGDCCSPFVVIDRPSGVVKVGGQLNLTCYAPRSQGLQIQWLRNGQVLPVDLSSVENVLSLSDVSAQDSGSYVCQLLSSSTPVARADVNVTVTSEPSVEMLCGNRPCHDDTIKRRDIFSPTAKLVVTCSVSTSLATVYWYRNGEDITAHSSGGVLTYKTGDDDGILGVYQCFAVTQAGVDYDTLRVLKPGFSNPPGNFTCRAIHQSSDVTKPSVILSWERPTLQAYYLDGDDGSVQPPIAGTYLVVYDVKGTTRNITVDNRANVNDTAVVDLPEDGMYTFSVYFTNRDFSTIVAVASCSVDTDLRRTTVPRRLNVSCPDMIAAGSNNTVTIPVEWTSPQKCPDLYLSTLSYKSICLYGNNTYWKPKTIINFLLSCAVDDEVYRFEVKSLPQGSVCLFGGQYSTGGISFKTLNIPPETCTVPKPKSTGRAQLKLSCSNSEAAVEIITPEGDALNSTELYGKCITPETPLGSHEHDLKPGNTSISGLPDGTICSFFGTYRLQTFEIEDFEPTQCVVGHMAPSTSEPTSPPATSPQTTAEELITTDKPELTSVPGSGFSLSPAAIIWVAVDISLVVVVIVTVVVACFVWKSYSRKVIKERRKQLHFWDDFITKQEGGDNLDQDPLVLPQFPCTLDAPDSLSITTEVDYLYKEEGRAVISNSSLSSIMKSMENDEKVIESPKLIMDRFLNGCHERVWEGSHESLCSVPPPQRQSGEKLSEQCQENAYEDADPVPSNSHVTSDPHTTTAQHYTIPLQSESTPGVKVLGVDSYIPSGGSSGYGTCSDHYFESGSSASMSTTNDYFKLRLADVAECNSLSTCEEEEGQQTVVAVTNHSRNTSSLPLLECSVNSSPEVTECTATSGRESLSRPNRPHHVMPPFKCTGATRYDVLTTQPTDHIIINNSSTCNNSLSDYAPSTLPPEHCFTDDEGYLRFTKETAV